MNLEAFPADPGLPQLKIASDPEVMREMFRGHLSPLPGRVYHIQDCLLSWVRYLRDVRCTLQYTLRLLEPGTGRERNQWVSGVIYAEDRAERMWRKLRAAHPGQEVPQAFLTFEPVSLIPDLNMLVQVFPYDRRIPALPLLMTGQPPDLEQKPLTGSARATGTPTYGTSNRSGTGPERERSSGTRRRCGMPRQAEGRRGAST